jgi:SAM-dependent methyltransferase
MFKEWLKMWRARSWMRRNQGFLPTWHAYVGYKMELFERFKEGASVEQVLELTGYDQALLESWVDVGLNVGHLQKQRDGMIRAGSHMSIYFRRDSKMAIGELLVEMMELHIPSLLAYPSMLTDGQLRTYDGQQFARTVASTSSMIEEAAFPLLNKWVKRRGSHSILDIGCGYAGYLLRLARSNRSLVLYGIEKEQELLDTAQRCADQEQLDSVHFLQGDFLGAGVSPLSDFKDRFDLVMMNNILYYFAPEHRVMLLKRAAEFLTAGGTMTMISPLRTDNAGKSNPFSSAFNSFMRAHDNLFDLPSLEEMKRHGSEAGLDLLTVQPIIREGNWYFCGFTKKGLN